MHIPQPVSAELLPYQRPKLAACWRWAFCLRFKIITLSAFCSIYFLNAKQGQTPLLWIPAVIALLLFSIHGVVLFPGKTCKLNLTFTDKFYLLCYSSNEKLFACKAACVFIYSIQPELNGKIAHVTENQEMPQQTFFTFFSSSCSPTQDMQWFLYIVISFTSVKEKNRENAQRSEQHFQIVCSHQNNKVRWGLVWAFAW